MKKVSGILILIILFNTACNKEDSKVKVLPAEINSSESIVISDLADDEIKMLYFYSPPHIFVDENGKLTGAVYDFIEEGIAPEMGVNFLWASDSTSIPREIDILKNNANAAVALLSLTEERSKVLAYPQNPYFTEQSVFAVLKTNPLDHIDTVDDILDLKIGYADGGVLPGILKDDRLNLELSSNSDYHLINIKKLNLGRIDAVFSPSKSTLSYIIREEKLADRIKLINIQSSESTYFIVFSQLAPELLSKYNDAFKKIDGKKFYLEKLKKYIGSDTGN